VAWSTIPVQLDEIRQIEVIKGPNSALYGFNAVSGVINIITYSPLYDSINTVTFRGGTQAFAEGSAVATARLGDDAGLRLSLGGLQSADVAPAGLAGANTDNRQSPLIGNFNLDGRARLAPGVEMTLQASMSDNRLPEDNLQATFDVASTRTNSLRAGVSADTSLGVLTVNAYRNEELFSILSSGLGNLAAWGQEDVYVVQANDLVKLGADHTIRVGVEYRNNSAFSPGFVGGTIGYDVYAGSMMWDWRISPTLSITNAVRVDSLHLDYSGTPAAGSGLTSADYNNTGFDVVSFNSGVVYQPTDKDTIRLMVARGVQVPSLIDFGLQLPVNTVGPVVVAGNPDVHPTIVYNLELDYDRAIPVIESTLRTALFAQRNEDLISEPLSTPAVIGPLGLPLLLANNVGSSNAVGMELDLHGHAPSGVRWNLSYAFVSTTNDTTLNRGSVVTSPINYARSVPVNMVSAGIGYTRGRLELDLMGRWQSSYLDFEAASGGTSLQPVNISDYLQLNARIGYRLTDNLYISGTVQQFNESRIMQTAGPPVERRAIVTISAHF